MTIIDVLEHQHRELDALFDELQVADDDEAGRLFQTVSTRWIASMRAAHATVYPRFAHQCGLYDEVRQATRDHERIESAINHVRLSALCPVEWREAIRALRTRVADHAASEQWVLFPIAHLMFTTDELREIADAYLAFETAATSVAAVSITYDAELPEWAGSPTVTRRRARHATIVSFATLSF